ncbi:MAG: hypothetical protein KAR15_01515, partial [Desulfobacterales bacterium]|nr:hypothetical protein [Desulfobacterales bacterium]
LITLIIILFTFSMIHPTAGEGEKYIPAKHIGKVLLDHMISGFKAIAIAGSGGYNVVDQLLQNSVVMLRKAKMDKAVDSVFYRRYKRILEVLKLTIINAKHDRENILNDHIAMVIQSFIYDITGEFKNLGSERYGIGLISEAVSFELLNLHIYLDTKNNRPELMKKYFEVPPPPPSKKKKK